MCLEKTRAIVIIALIFFMSHVADSAPKAFGPNIVRLKDISGLATAATIQRIFFIPDSERMLTISRRCITVWDRPQMTRVSELRVPPVLEASLSADGGRVCTLGEDLICRIWDISSRTLVSELPLATKGNYERDWASMAFSPAPETLLAIGYGDQVHVWDYNSKKLIETQRLATGMVTSIAFSKEGDKLICVGGQGVVVFNKRGAHVRSRLHFHCYTKARIAPNGLLVAVDTLGKDIRIRRTDSDRYAISIKSRLPVRDFAFSPDSKILAAACDGGKVLLFHVDNGQLLAEAQIDNGQINSVAFAIDAKSLVVAGNTLRVFDVRNVESIRRQYEQVSISRFDALWGDLADPNFERGQAAVYQLVAVPTQTIAFLKKRLVPAKSADPVRVDALIRNLESGEFTIRNKAMAELQELHWLAKRALQDRLAKGPKLSLEGTRRVRALLRKCDDVRVPETIQINRAVRMLWMIGSLEARELVDEVSKGTAEAFLTQEALEMARWFKGHDSVTERNAMTIQEGMTAAEVEWILGKESDGALFPGGTLGDRIDFWRGKGGTIRVRFGMENSRVASVTLTPREH